MLAKAYVLHSLASEATMVQSFGWKPFEYPKFGWEPSVVTQREAA